MFRSQFVSFFCLTIFVLTGGSIFAQVDTSNRILCGHEVLLDDQGKILPRKVGSQNPYDHFLRLRWNFIKTKVPFSPGPPPRSMYPQYFFYCAFKDSSNVLLPDTWMNDVGEKIPMWFESARLFYSYSQDEEPLNRAKAMMDYHLEHGISPANYNWPNFPQTTADAGALEFRGFTARFAPDDGHVDHAGDIGAAYYKMYLLKNESKYRDAAIRVANVLAGKVKKGTETESPWPYMVNLNSGKVVSEYGTNWFGCIKLLSMLVEAGDGNVDAYKKTLNIVKDWLMKYPVKNGIWVDGHTDVYLTGRTNLSNLSASNAGLYISDHPDYTDSWKSILPSLIRWTEENFVYKSAPGEPSNLWGANIVSEQVLFMPKMDYQTARYAAQCAKLYRMTQQEVYKEKAFRSLNLVTYCVDSVGKAFESPFSKGVPSWWSDSYGECPLMFYHVLSAIPAWAPAGEDHILYTSAIIKDVMYQPQAIRYTATEKTGTEYLRLSFKPASVKINGMLVNTGSASGNKVIVADLGDGDYSVEIKRTGAGKVEISAN